MGVGVSVGGAGSVGGVEGLVLGLPGSVGLPDAGGLLGLRPGLGVAVPGLWGRLLAPVPRPGERVPVVASSLRPTGRLPVPSGISWVPLR